MTSGTSSSSHVSIEEIDVYLGNGVSGTITVPPAARSTESIFSQGLAPPTHKAALIVHGQGGHRNYCYQKQLAHRLANDLGMYSLRIDFRGCGSSADNTDPVKGRVLSQDIEDIQQSAEFLLDGTQNPLGIDFTLSTIVGHSRGSLAMFLWALKQDALAKSEWSSKAIIVPNLVNCSSRYQSHTVYDRYPIRGDDDFDGVEQNVLRHGKFQPVMITKTELVDLAEADLSGLSDLSLDFSVLSIYGLEDHIIPIVDSAHFSNALNRGHLSHRLELIPLADHNFYGAVAIENEDDADTYNPDNLPLNRSGFANFNGIVVDKIVDYLRPENELQRFLHISKNIGHLSRWKQIEGVSNFRDIGGWRITNPRFPLKSPVSGKYYVKHNLMFRCAHMGKITENGLNALKTMGVKAIFDLRSSGETSRDGYPQNLEKHGIKRIHAPVFSEQDYSPQSIAIRYTNLTTSWHTYVDVYDDMLLNGGGAFKTVFEFIRDNKDTPFVFHCTAGKDRTGILAMLILLLVGLDKHTIAKEFELTTIGLKPDHEEIKKNFIKLIEKTKSRMDDPSELEKSIGKGRANWTIYKDGFENLISSRYEAMLSTIEMFNQKFGGIVAYLKKAMGFTDDDILKVYENLMVVNTLGFFKEDTFIEWSHRNSMGPNL
ncbi:hypothetical protein PSN45_001865 [Yamadazyma tenuis]|uniref:Tyrosine specific protein phosphatases domain-containing protein n=1 Tax=Candida tenuis (strain ATCC 10573 / BCRC 21748 / CBS 615 / JCM 9827 / NBRC 10315 / NRRL Y-1498 / VKM Y-70) TaxID=590646 RepID=G3BDT1_CANTC|nr:uncharacterized protein CANTEDRAFT_127559 [Yamadazyma tenuis ATCC 10573]EGV60373.1 hypothetical protein CANTEDRAFT_127559 [Yamadazyma tenuis ATCC 10573]WEJ94381.1 hypothetical protein PSN45_001865 [Yamadazyma tenuis]